MKLKLIVLFSFLFSLHCYSQQIENVNFKVDNHIMVVTYDLGVGSREGGVGSRGL